MTKFKAVGDIIPCVNKILDTALDCNASRILLHPTKNGLEVRVQCPSGTVALPPVPPNLSPSVSCRVKIMANLSIAEKRSIQIGSFKHRRRKFRVNCLPLGSLEGTGCQETLVLETTTKAA